MNIRIHLASLILAYGALSVAQGAMIINDNFDSYANQAAFEAVWTPIGTVAPISGELSTAQASSPTQSVRNPGTVTNSQSRNQQIFSESGAIGIGDKLVWSFDFYDSAPTGAPQRNHSNLQDTTAPTSTNQLIAMGFNNNQTGANSGGQFYMARILGYTVPTTADPDGGPAESVGGSGAFFKLNDFGVGARSLGWHNLKAILSTDDGLSTDFEFYVDNVLAEKVSDVGTAATIRSYDTIRIGSGLSNGSTEVFFDNMQLEFIAVPEPATFMLAGMALLGLVAARRRPA
jgi:PEP-CTERM motif